MGQELAKGAKAIDESLRAEQARVEAERLEAERLKAKELEESGTSWEAQAAGLPAWELASLRAAHGWVIGQPVAPSDFAAALESVRNEVVQ